MAIRTNGLGQRLTRGQALGQAILLDPRAVALGPLRPTVPGQPRGGGLSQGVESRPQGLADTLQPVERTDRRQDVSGVGALLAPRLDQTALAQALEQDLEQALILIAGEQARSELAQNRNVEPRVGQLQAQRLRPVNAASHRLGRLTVGQVLEDLEQRDQRQPPGCNRRLPPGLVEGGKPGVVVQNPDLIADPHQQGALAKGRPGHARRVLGNRIDR